MTLPSETARRVVVASLALAIGLIVHIGLSATPAQACTCTTESEAEAFAWADVVFEGKVLSVVFPPMDDQWSTADPVTWTFDVSEVYKGEAADIQEVVSALDSASCGVDLSPEETYVVFALEQDRALDLTDGQLSTHLCSGTRPARHEPVAVASQPSPPAAVPTPTGTLAPAPTAGPSTTIAATVVDSTDAPGTTVPPPATAPDPLADPERVAGGLGEEASGDAAIAPADDGPSLATSATAVGLPLAMAAAALLATRRLRADPG